MNSKKKNYVFYVSMCFKKKLCVAMWLCVKKNLLIQKYL